MASKIFKRFAVLAGAGLAIGLKSGSKVNRRNRGSSMSTSADDILSLEPILDRLDQIEDRMSAMEMRPEQQAKDLAALQLQMTETREKVAEQVAAVQWRFAKLEKDLPVMLESMIAPQVAGIRDRMLEETRKNVEGTLLALERNIENRISQRISKLEKALIDQSGIITTLSERAIESDTNLQRLISAVEKLCEARPTTPAARAPSSFDQPFESHLTEAIKRQPEAPHPDSVFRPRIVKEESDGRSRPRTPMTRI